jgi:sugar lactone lactonase YvrE
VDEFEAIPASEASYAHGEGPRYDAAHAELLWVDIGEGRLLRADPDRLDLVTEIRLDRMLGAVAPAAGGGWIAAAGTGLAMLGRDGRQTTLAELEPPGNRMNDAACDPQGRFWAGSMALDERPNVASLYRLGPGGELTVVLDGLSIANGLGWSPDGETMYHADSGTATITAYDFDPGTGEIERPRIIVRPPHGVPDGLCVDHEGLLWVALYGGAAVARYEPGGREVARIPLPVSRVTSCAFVGERLFITTASRHAADAEPDAGRLFAADVGVGGPPASQYIG